MVVTVEGRDIDLREVQSVKAPVSMVARPFGNVIVSRDEHSIKQAAPTLFTFEGNEIVFREMDIMDIPEIKPLRIIITKQKCFDIDLIRRVSWSMKVWLMVQRNMYL